MNLWIKRFKIHRFCKTILQFTKKKKDKGCLCRKNCSIWLLFPYFPCIFTDTHHCHRHRHTDTQTHTHSLSLWGLYCKTHTHTHTHTSQGAQISAFYFGLLLEEL